MIYYKPGKISIDVPGLAKVIIDVLVRHYGLLDSIVFDQASLFTLKFWSFLCYFVRIKRWLFIFLDPQTDC